MGSPEGWYQAGETAPSAEEIAAHLPKIDDMSRFDVPLERPAGDGYGDRVEGANEGQRVLRELRAALTKEMQRWDFSMSRRNCGDASPIAIGGAEGIVRAGDVGARRQRSYARFEETQIYIIFILRYTL